MVNPELGALQLILRKGELPTLLWCHPIHMNASYFICQHGCRWEYCDVPNCPGSDLETCGTYDWKQKDYVGIINVTISGIACQPWADQTPHFHYELPALLPEANLVDNYCRNPTGDERAWCYTSSEDVIWEYCEVPFCTSEEERQKSLVCGSRSERQSDYRGTISVTESGRRCKRWDSDFAI